jgi:hypothetical protein
VQWPYSLSNLGNFILWNSLQLYIIINKDMWIYSTHFIEDLPFKERTKNKKKFDLCILHSCFSLLFMRLVWISLHKEVLCKIYSPLFMSYMVWWNTNIGASTKITNNVSCVPFILVFHWNLWDWNEFHCPKNNHATSVAHILCHIWLLTQSMVMHSWGI